ncbi:hypothetical protein AB0912_15530 [Streptomyces sp. NPDC007084]|uniref:hypothetical protein n=1 Tax=Streptomyces sp. NPDC007084 TaxID=3154313 RepID=UPI003452FCFF
MGRLERRLAKANPYASTPSTAEREKAAKKKSRSKGGESAKHHREAGGRDWKPRWPF